MEIIFQIGFSVGLIILAMFTGTLIERRHYISIMQREDQFKRLPAVPNMEYETGRGVAESKMVVGSVVVSIDYFKRFLAGLYNIFGGEVSSYASLLDRGRREAILRMKSEFPTADIIVNLRLETSMIGNNSQKGLGSIEVIAYGTAIKYEK